MSQTGKERRTKKRVSVKQCNVVFHRRKNWFFFEKGRFKSEILDISDGGISMNTAEYLPIGTSLSMHFQSDSDKLDVPQDFTIDAVVVYSTPIEEEGGGYRTGLRFTDTSEDTSEIVHDLIRQALEAGFSDDEND
jgi:c-di-GMP-binding flagellar brake protein YcgR